MKKLFSYLLVAILLLSFGLSGCSSAANQDVSGAKSMAQLKTLSSVEGAAVLAGADDQVEDSLISTPINLTDATGVMTFGNGTHSGHQTRIVHTSHGDYVAYLSDEVIDKSLTTLNEFSILKIQDGEVTLLYQDYISYDSSSISIFADENEEVYAVTLNQNHFTNATPGAKESSNLAVWHVNSETDQVIGYTATIEHNISQNSSYAQPVIDTVNHKIYGIFSGGDEPGLLKWFIFDMDSKQWEKGQYSITIPTRHCYHFAYADGKGGVVIVNQQDRKAASAGHDEISTAPLWSAGYVWDQLDMYYIPNMYDDSLFYSYCVQEADYSRVHDLDGDGLYTSDEERQTNEYANVTNNHTGDTYLDSKGNLHVLYTIEFMRAAYDRAMTEATQWHAVYDISDPANVQLLSKEQVIFEGFDEDTPEKNSFEFRMAEDTNGTLYIVAMHCADTPDSGRLLLYQLSEKDVGYDYTLVYVSEKLSDRQIDSGYSLSGSRSLSVMDNTISMIFSDGNINNVSGVVEDHARKDWHYLTLNLPAASLVISTDSLADATVGSAYEEAVNVSYSGDGTLVYTAQGLPEGLSIDSATGKISGTPAAGTDVNSPYTVKVTVTDGKMTADKDFTLVVRPQGQFVITVTTNKGGMVLPVGGKITVMRGESQSFAIVADNGYGIADVLVDGKSVGAVTKYTFENVTEDHTLEVKFQKRYVISDGSGSSGSGGSGSSDSDSSGGKDNVDTGALM